MGKKDRRIGGVGNLLHLILSVATSGKWLPIWLLHAVAVHATPGFATPRDHVRRLVQREKALLGTARGRADVGQICRVLGKKKAFIEDARAFNDTYAIDLQDEIADGQLDWNNENCTLFFEMCRRKHRVNAKTTLTVLLYLREESIYAGLRDALSHMAGSSSDVFMREAVLADLYSGLAPKRHRLKRLMWELEIGRCWAPVSAYRAAHEDLKLQKFEKSLRAGSREAAPMTEQLRQDAVSARIGTLLESTFDTDDSAYVIVGADYSRDSTLDRIYRARFAYVLSRAFDGHCCMCGEGMGQLEFDHFWHPKSEGGNFVMRSRDGHYVNNCVPLCRSCNASKGKRDFREFFGEQQILDIVSRSQSMNEYINQHLAEYNDLDFPGRAF